VDCLEDTGANDYNKVGVRPAYSRAVAIIGSGARAGLKKETGKIELPLCAPLEGQGGDICPVAGKNNIKRRPAWI